MSIKNRFRLSSDDNTRTTLVSHNFKNKAQKTIIVRCLLTYMLMYLVSMVACTYVSKMSTLHFETYLNKNIMPGISTMYVFTKFLADYVSRMKWIEISVKS